MLVVTHHQREIRADHKWGVIQMVLAAVAAVLVVLVKMVQALRIILGVKEE
jgi:hypothetical protein